MRNLINLFESKKAEFVNELGNDISVKVVEKDIEGVDGIFIEMIGPESVMENHITRMEAEILYTELKKILDM